MSIDKTTETAPQEPAQAGTPAPKKWSRFHAWLDALHDHAAKKTEQRPGPDTSSEA